MVDFNLEDTILNFPPQNSLFEETFRRSRALSLARAFEILCAYATTKEPEAIQVVLENEASSKIAGVHGSGGEFLREILRR